MSPKSPFRRHLASFTELLGSMRFAISLLMFICIASLIGTVLDQNQVTNQYIDQFGPFWYSLFNQFSIWNIYNSWWFLIIMAFLVVSTTLCLLRNTPKMLRDARSFREYVRASSLRAFPQRLEVELPEAPAQAVSKVGALLRGHGYRFKTREDADGVMIAAKKGSANRMGYIFAHAAIVVICLGGLIDSELPIHLQMWLGGKQPVVDNMFISEVPEDGRLSAANPSYRANMLLPEGSTSRFGIVAAGDGVLIQPLPFAIRLNRFVVDYYPTGMPSSFKSEVEVIDPNTGERFEKVIEVNEPLRYKGLAVYQSSFEDGGSRVTLEAWPVAAGESSANRFKVDATVGKSQLVTFQTNNGPQELELDVTNLRVINVENLDGTPPQPRAMIEHVAAVTGSAARLNNENLRNVGPSVEYRVIGADGQAYEYNNYMLPVQLDELSVFLLGVRTTPSENYRYLRLPADTDQSPTEFMRLREALNNDALRAEAASVFGQKSSRDSAQQALLQQGAKGVLDSFAFGGFEALVQRVPEADREAFLGFAIPMLQASLIELHQLARAQEGLEPFAQDRDPDWHARWNQAALLALANLPEYPAPVFFALSDFDKVEASVFQIARSPGKVTVYLGSLFLIIGVFSMFYIRDRRIWVWVKPEGHGSSVMAAMTSQRRNLDFHHEYQRFSTDLKQLASSKGET